MKKQRTFEEYRTIDLFLWAVMLAVFEFIIVRVSKSAMFSDELYTVSLAGAMTSIVYMRWGFWGGIHAALAGLLFSIYSGGTAQQIAIYTFGNLFSLAAVLPLNKLGKERVRTGGFLSLLFPLSVILLMQAGRAVISIAVGASVSEALAFFPTDSLSDVFTLVIVWICRRLDGIYEDQKHYLLRINQEDTLPPLPTDGGNGE